MSVKVMSWVWDNGPASGAERLVLLALADFCDDAGRCWPSMARIAAKGCVTERGAQKIIRRLEAEGWVKIATGGGRHGCNEYQLTIGNPELETVNHVRPERGSPRTGEQKPRTRVQETPNHGSPEPSGTIIEPSEEKKEPAAAALYDPHARAAAAEAEPEEDPLPAILSAARIDVTKDISGKWFSQRWIVQRWRDQLGLSWPEITARIAELAAGRKGYAPPGSLRFFDPVMEELAARKTQPPLKPRPSGFTRPDDMDAKRRRWKRIAAGGRA